MTRFLFVAALGLTPLGLMSIKAVVAENSPVADEETRVELVGAGTISMQDREFATSISVDDESLYFNRSDIEGVWHIWISQRAGVGWSKAEKIWFSDARYSDVDPFVSRSGDRLYFSSDRPVPAASDPAPTPDNNTWYSPWSDGRWGTPVYAGTVINSGASETFLSESADGQIIFVRFGEGAGRARPAHLMTATRSGDGFMPPRRIATRPEKLRLTNPAISPDGNLIVAAGTRGDSPRLYFSRRQAGGQWAAFQPFSAPINLPDSAQYAPYIGNDGRTLYFSSDRPSQKGGGGDIYKAVLP